MGSAVSSALSCSRINGSLIDGEDPKLIIFMYSHSGLAKPFNSRSSSVLFPLGHHYQLSLAGKQIMSMNIIN